jgi:hypothetical protein
MFLGAPMTLLDQALKVIAFSIGGSLVTRRHGSPS